ncbi:MAG: hypothetical protein FJZ58_07200 [Chlamydiae bacterium]|nr:hypothetical protein [Chlamydiota bacterium]
MARELSGTPKAKEAIDQTRKIIYQNYGPRPNVWEIVSLGWCNGARAETLRNMIATEKGTRKESQLSFINMNDSFWTMPRMDLAIQSIPKWLTG